MAHVRPRILLLLLCSLAACRPTPTTPPIIQTPAQPAPILPPPGPVRYLKGQTHAHSSFSRDSNTPPAEVVRWYEAHGFDFVVFTDHNHVTVAESTERLLAIPGVELTQNLPDCTPPPPPESGMQCLLHMNVLFAKPGPIPWPVIDNHDRLAVYSIELDVAQKLGGIAQLNHPNFHYGAGPRTLREMARRGLPLFEVANQSVDANNQGDQMHPDTEDLWDAALAGAKKPLFGTATDDAHHYWDQGAVVDAGETAFTGDRGFIMVRARKDPASIREAIERGDFYASNGVILKQIVLEKDALVVEAESDGRTFYDFELIGEGSEEPATQHGTAARFLFREAKPGWARVTVKDRKGHTAWVQPVRVPEAEAFYAPMGVFREVHMDDLAGDRTPEELPPDDGMAHLGRASTFVLPQRDEAGAPVPVEAGGEGLFIHSRCNQAGCADGLEDREHHHELIAPATLPGESAHTDMESVLRVLDADWQNRRVSLLRLESRYTRGAGHSNNSTECLTFDRKTGRRLKLSDLVGAAEARRLLARANHLRDDENVIELHLDPPSAFRDFTDAGLLLLPDSPERSNQYDIVLCGDSALGAGGRVVLLNLQRVPLEYILKP